MIDRKKPFYSKEEAGVLYQRGLMPEYVYRQLYFDGKENLLYYWNKRQQETAEKLNQQKIEKEVEKQIEEAVEKEVSKMIENIFGQGKK